MRRRPTKQEEYAADILYCEMGEVDATLHLRVRLRDQIRLTQAVICAIREPGLEMFSEFKDASDPLGDKYAAEVWRKVMAKISPPPEDD